MIYGATAAGARRTPGARRVLVSMQFLFLSENSKYIQIKNISKNVWKYVNFIYFQFVRTFM